MSYELEYFPPNGTRWKWTNKILQYSPWSCSLSWQWAGDRWPSWHPMSVRLIVDLIDGEYTWTVNTTDWAYKRNTHKGKAATGLQACLDAEIVGERVLMEMTPEWVQNAIDAGWRPPYKDAS